MHDFLSDVVIKIVHKTITTKPLTSDQMLREELSAFNKHLNSYLDQPDKILRQNVKELIRKYVDQFGEDGYTGRFSSFKASFRHLQKQIKPV